MTLNDKIKLPQFLYEDDGRVLIGFHGDSDATEEWNNHLNEIEKLIIQDKIDLIDSLDIDTVGNLIKSIVSKRNELLGKLNAL